MTLLLIVVGDGHAWRTSAQYWCLELPVGGGPGAIYALAPTEPTTLRVNAMLWLDD